MSPLLNSLIASLIVSSVSFIGLILLIKKFEGKSRIVTALVAFAAGSLLGDVFLHLLAEHIEGYGYETNTIVFIFAGILLMLIIEAYFHCSHDSREEIEEHDHHILAKVNIIGDGLHNFLDGIAIAASFLISPAAGLASTFAVILHEIPQELADAGILSYSGWKRKKILLFNFLTALTAILGVLLVFGIESIVEGAEKYLVPVAAGQFIYIALSDLVPEIHKKAGVKKYILEISMFILGIGVMYLLTLAE